MAGLTPEKLRGLKPAQAAQLRRAVQTIESGQATYGAVLLLDLARSAPDHPEVLRWRGWCHAQSREWALAADSLARSHAQRPGDFGLLLQLGSAQEQAGALAASARSLALAAGLATRAEDWLALSIEHDRQGAFEPALAAVQQALQQPRAPALALLQRVRCATALGQAELAAADCRALIARGEWLARAWFALLDLKVVRLSAAELAQLEALVATAPRTPGLTHDDLVLLQFALGKALEDAGRRDEALAMLQAANASAAATRPWDAAAFERQVAAIRAAFETSAAPPPAAAASALGREVIFLVGLPRSATTLVEQVLASHSQVEGASELPYLRQVVDEESRRRGRVFPLWVAQASADDWARMGQRYLALSARWRSSKPIATDKLPENWLLAGAALRMLPQARIIDCRRDPVETCWSCFKQLFGPGMVHFSYSFEGLAGYWRAYDGLARFWAAQEPARFRAQSYEALVAEPEVQIRALLDFCGLPFEPGCLQFHTAQRAVRTPSALQVRQPMRTASAPAQAYGARLDRLRELLGPATLG